MRKHLKIECLSTIFFILTLPGISQDYSSSSVLSSGKWYRISVTGDNIYRVDYSTLKALGLENPSNPRIFGNNTGQLSYYNDGSQPDDLKEIAIFTNTGTDGIFNEGDYLLFFGLGTARWIYDYSTGEFNHKKHNYSDTAFYFLTSGQTPGRKVTRSEVPVNVPDQITETSDDLFIHEIDSDNILHSGREWYQNAGSGRDIEVNPGFRDVITTEKIKYKIMVLARASVSTRFSFSDSKSTLSSVQVEGINPSSTTGIWARTAELTGEVFPQSSEPAFRVSYSNNGEISARGWLDNVILHARKQNKFDGRYSAFIDSRSVNEGMVTEFAISGEAENVIVWDVSDPFNPREQTLTVSGGKIRFRSETDSLKTFIAFSPTYAKIADIDASPVPNQDLHSSNAADMVIVVHPLFYPYAVRLAELHRTSSGLESLVITPQQIYNEFSGGTPDIVAIRNFLRMKYQRQKNGERKLQYLLLFGDGSYDNRT
ncbi:MAG: C25 family cysteine peptidase, partial [Bacteroidales bacterium]|nr:C25 family cysteine peptidase [Bacteroidales bacterium]